LGGSPAKAPAQAPAQAQAESQDEQARDLSEILNTALLLKMKGEGHNFKEKFERILDQLGQPTLARKALADILEEAFHVKERDGYTFTPSNANQDFSKKLEEVTKFTPEENASLSKLVPIQYRAEPPKQYEILGEKPYFLSGNIANGKVPLYGVEGFEEDAPIILDDDEKEEIEGTPLGAIMLLYLTAFSRCPTKKSQELME